MVSSDYKENKCLRYMKTLYRLVILGNILISCQSNSEYKTVKLNSGRISMQIPKNWNPQKIKDNYPETVFEQYWGNSDSSGVFIEIRNKHFSNINELSSIIKDKTIHLKEDIKIIKEDKILGKRDTTYVIYYSDKDLLNYAVAYNADIKRDISTSKIYYFHDNTKSSKEFEILVNNITKSITYSE